MVWQFWGRAAERVLSLIARDVFFAVKNVSPGGATKFSPPLQRCEILGTMKSPRDG